MKGAMGKRLVLALAILAVAVAVSAESMAEAARKERERREQNRAKGVKAKTFTEDNVKPGAESGKDGGKGSFNASPAQAPASGAYENAPEGPAPRSSAPGPSTARVGEREPSVPGSGSEDAKRARGQELKIRLQEAESSLRSAEARLAVAQRDYEMWVSKPSFGVSDLAQKNLQTAKRWLEEARRKRDEVEDIARREGIPAGYLR